MNYPTIRPSSRRVPSPRESVLFLVHSNVFVSVGAASVAVTATYLADLPLSPVPPFVVFAATMFVYGSDRVVDAGVDAATVPDRAAFARRHGRGLLAVGVALYLCATAVAVLVARPWAACMALPLVVTVLYSVLGVKRYFLVKNLLVGASWGLVPLGVGVYHDAIWRIPVWFFATYVAAMLTLAAVVFDVKDVPGDRAAGVRTVPSVYGPARTRTLAQCANALACAAVLAAVVAGLVGVEFLALVAFNAYVGGYAAVATPDRGPLFYGFVVDGEHLFLAVVVVATHLIPGIG